MVIFGLHLRGGLEINTFAPEKLDPVPGLAGNNTHGQMVTLCSGSAVIITPPVLLISRGIFTSAEKRVRYFRDEVV